ncbi:MAG: glycoside hydrolase family 55 protein [Oligoflexia bacterium]|nr:glycoside hydrolase family 55 protein [Oligoflexia bacterium]
MKHLVLLIALLAFFGPIPATADVTADLQRAIDSAIASGPGGRVTFPEGIYHLDCGNSTRFGTCLQISGAAGLRLAGSGADKTRFVISNPQMGFLSVSDSSDVEIGGFAIDYSSVPFTQGTVLQVDGVRNELSVALDAGYPRFDAAIFSAQNLSTTFGMIFDPNTARLKKGIPDHFGIGYAEAKGDGSWRVGLSAVNGIAAGDRFVLPHRGSSLFTFFRNQGIRFRGVRVAASPGLVSAWVQNHGVIGIEGIEIHRTGNRLLSSTADAFHLLDNDAKVSITGCTLEGMADDALNTRSTAFPIVAIEPGGALILDGQGVRGFAPGQLLQVVDPATQLPRGASAIVSAWTRPDGRIRVYAQGGIAGARAGDLVFNASFATPNILVRGNVFSYFRGIFRVRSPGAILAYNRVEDPENARVLVSADIVPSWKEGPSLLDHLPGVYFYGNSVSGGDFNLLKLNYQNAGVPQLSGTDALLSHPLAFDPEFYRSFYWDLAGMSESGLRSHWLRHGIQEARRGSAGLSPEEYLELYPDLSRAFGSDRISGILHFLLFGNAQELRSGSWAGGPHVFDPTAYRALNQDLGGMSVSQLGVHWLRHGIGEGRRAHLKFHSREYLALYADLRDHLGGTGYGGAIRHFVAHGATREFRSGSYTTDARVYLPTEYASRNSDLAGLSELELGAHWLLHGIGEGRQASPDFWTLRYLSLYPDLQSAFGSDYRAALEHFVLHGLREGRVSR